MRRRTLLRGLAAVGATGLAGCSTNLLAPDIERPPHLDSGIETTRLLDSPSLRYGLEPSDDRFFHVELVVPSTDGPQLTDAGREDGSFALLESLPEGTFAIAAETRTSVADPYGLSTATREIEWTDSDLRIELESRDDFRFGDDVAESDPVVAVSATRYEHDRDREPETATVVLPNGLELAVDAAP